MGRAVPVYDPSANVNAGPGGDGSGAGGQRYNYLVGRLRNRQITMEEATELFTLMQGILARANAQVRAAAAYRAPAIVAPTAAPLPPPPPRGPAAPSSADDFLLVGLLAMGAGAGLLAALSKRIGDTSAAAPAGTGSSNPSAGSR